MLARLCRWRGKDSFFHAEAFSIDIALLSLTDLENLTMIGENRDLGLKGLSAYD